MTDLAHVLPARDNSELRWEYLRRGSLRLRAESQRIRRFVHARRLALREATLHHCTRGVETEQRIRTAHHR